MAILRVTTKSANQVWKSPDGKIEMFELGLEWDGKAIQAKTYSKAIAQPGWSGEVESYDKTGQNGVETFVKQPKKDDAPYGGGGGKREQDPFTMYLSYAKDLVVAYVATGGKMELDDMVAATIMYGNTLFDSRPSAEAKATVAAPATVSSPVAAVFENGEPIPTEEDPWHPKTS